MKDEVLFPFPLWHGTQKRLLPRILAEGFGTSNLAEEIGAVEFLRTALNQLNITEMGLHQRGCTYKHSAVFALNAMAQRADRMNWQHGQGYLATSMSHASSYAMRAPEIVSICRHFVDEHFQEWQSTLENTLSGFPCLQAAMMADSEPMVLRFNSVCKTDLLSEKGQKLSEVYLNKILGTIENSQGIGSCNVSFQASFYPGIQDVEAWIVKERNPYNFEYAPVDLENMQDSASI